MPGPTKLPGATRYFQPGLTKIIIVPAIASANLSPTLAELNAGTDISGDIADVTGFSVSTADIATPDWGKRFTSSVPGRITADASSITLYADPAGVDARTLLVQDAATNVVILANGLVAGSSMSVYKCSVSSVAIQRPTEDTPKLLVSFTIRDYRENLTYPTT